MRTEWAGQKVTPTSGHEVWLPKAVDGPAVFENPFNTPVRVRRAHLLWAYATGKEADELTSLERSMAFVSYVMELDNDLDADQENDRPAE